jgi:hypothetical protein
MTRSRAVLLVVTVVLTLAAYALSLLVTGFVACGISGCSGGGFGPSFAPRQAQVGLVVAALVPLPLALLLLSPASRARRTAGGLLAVAAAGLLAMLLLGLDPHGCPAAQSRAVDSQGEPTCSADDDARA